MSKRYLRKMRFLDQTLVCTRSAWMHLLRRIKADLPLPKKWLLDAREQEEDDFYRRGIQGL
jgi:hypothetical protein